MRPVLRRVALLMAAAGAGVLAAGMVVAGAGPAVAAPKVLYAAAAAAGSGDCSAAADACTLSTALADVTAGGTIELVTAGGTAHYVGNWEIGTTGTRASAPVTIEAAPGLASQPVLDGNHGGSTGCSTSACDGPVLDVPSGVHVALSGITIADGTNVYTGTGGYNGTGDGGGLDVRGTVTITACIFSGNLADNNGGAIDSGDHFRGGSVTVTACTFTGNTAENDGGAIDSGDSKGGGSVTVIASTFSGNNAYNGGGAIDSGSLEGGGSVTVTASTFTGNSASQGIVSPYGDGGAIDSGDARGGGSVTVTASTFTGNTATADGGAIDSGDFSGGGSVTVTASTFTGNIGYGDGPGYSIHSGGGTMAVAGDLFNGSCDRPAGTWADGGYNAGTDTTCFAAAPAAGDTSSSAVGSDLQAGLTSNGGPTQTIAPTTGNPAIGLIPGSTTVTLGSSQVQLCPATDQRGYATPAGTACDGGAVQTSGSAPALALKDSATPASFNKAGQVITYTDEVSNIGTGPLTAITVTDPAVPHVSCPSATLAAGTSETCTGTYTTTAADLGAGKITDTATATAAAGGVPVASNTATVTVPRGWPPVVTGTHQPAPGAAEGYYLGVTTTSTWQLLVTHPGTTKVSFTGHITVPAGTLGHLTLIHPGSGHVSNTGKAITFTLPDSGKVTGFSFTTSAQVTSITFTLDIGGHPATATRIYLGGTPTHPHRGSPLTYTR